jgi:hypothetical protein
LSADEKFFNKYLDLIEFAFPKLARSELTGKDGTGLQINVTNYSELQQAEIAKRVLDTTAAQDTIPYLQPPKKLQNNKK